MARSKAARKKSKLQGQAKRSGERRSAAPRAGSDFGALSPGAREEKGDVIALEETVQAGVKRARVRSQSMLDRYLLRDQISRRQYDAGERLHRLWRASGAAPMVVANYGPRIKGGGDISDRQAALRADIGTVLTAIGSRQASVLIHVCLCDEAAGDWGGRHRGRATDGIPILRLALDGLADYWGMPQ
jgi:hypothetical protein